MKAAFGSLVLLLSAMVIGQADARQTFNFDDRQMIDQCRWISSQVKPITARALERDLFSLEMSIRLGQSIFQIVERRSRAVESCNIAKQQMGWEHWSLR